jgi:hypothetical protein
MSAFGPKQTSATALHMSDRNKSCPLYPRKRPWMRTFGRPLRANSGHRNEARDSRTWASHLGTCGGSVLIADRLMSVGVAA